MFFPAPVRHLLRAGALPSLVLALVGLPALSGPAGAAAAPRPNVVLILADDMGFSDLGCYGGEIPTPHLDSLARGGLRFTQFYNTARCSPTRAALLTGLHPHQVGLGTLAEDPGKRAPADAAPGYREFLDPRRPTLAELLRPAGYRSYLAGKWHLGYHGREKWPLQRGFDRFYGIISGASSYHLPREPRGLTLDNDPLPPPDARDYYTTDAFTDHALEFVSAHPRDTPFFLYLAFTAPHWPLHARTEDIALFTGRYRAGWDRLRAERFARQRELGIVPPHTVLSPRDDGARAWDALSPEEQTRLDRRMAVYAAQVHRMDWNIGRVVALLRERGQLENTLILFLSDNGGCAEPYTDIGGGSDAAVNRPDAGGSGGRAAPDGGSSYGTGWANLSNTPFRRYKSRLHQGGIATPLVVHWPAGLRTAPGSLTSARGYLTDVVPTVLALAGATYPESRDGHTLPPPAGRSLVPVLATGTRPDPGDFYWEQYDNKAIRRGDWKAVQPAEAGSPWELYDLARDPAELTDLAARRPELLAELTSAWKTWADTHQVYPKNPAPAAPKKNKKK